MDINVLGEYASQITSITVIGGALIWIYNVLIGRPNRELERKVSEKNSRDLRETIVPLTYQIRTLNDNLKESQEDRKNIHAELEEHDDRIHNHENRITILETKHERTGKYAGN